MGEYARWLASRPVRPLVEFYTFRAEPPTAKQVRASAAGAPTRRAIREALS